MTSKQKAIHEFIRNRLQEGKNTTVRDIQHYMGFASPNGAQCHLKWMQKKGVVYRDRKTGKLKAVTYHEGAGLSAGMHR